VFKGPKGRADDWRQESKLFGESISPDRRALQSHEVGEEVINPRREGDLLEETPFSTDLEAP
jgi:hypothetical protein